ncbi:MAG: methylated-DNA--[protein]-cysteine S-methyltransferase [gamma proteobacterium symbiont of Bathyaustriella thionipta]|nr:methylated-DNA--[protein]-cysteine S-methyltransferase [gamma proteobacterium symbiont of Bathyaustriella thionipta]
MQTELGTLRIRHDDRHMLSLRFVKTATAADTQSDETVLGHLISSRIRAYLHASQEPLDLPFTLNGSPFQQRVWQALRDIPAGQTLTYGELAKKLYTAARAVGNACRNNPLPLVVPCHRIISANGLGGYCGALSGKPADIKRWLLRHEGHDF